KLSILATEPMLWLDNQPFCLLNPPPVPLKKGEARGCCAVMFNGDFEQFLAPQNWGGHGGQNYTGFSNAHPLSGE
ncbi:MAG: hypothetical protein ACRDEA_08485, partial [Microcystaceae cyanobacterium]